MKSRGQRARRSKVADLVSQPVTVEHRPHEDPAPSLALEAGRTHRDARDPFGRSPCRCALADLVDDRIGIDDPPLDETRPQEEIVYDRRDPASGKQAGVFYQERPSTLNATEIVPPRS